MTYYVADMSMPSYILAFLKNEGKKFPITSLPKALDIVWSSQTRK